MLDPLAALDLAANIVCLVDLTPKIIHACNDLAKSGGDLLAGDGRLSNLPQQNHQMSERIVSSINALSAPTQHEAAVRLAAQECAASSRKLLDVLDGITHKTITIKHQTRGFIRRTTKVAYRQLRRNRLSIVLRSYYKQHELEILRRQLSTGTRQLVLALLVLMRHNQNGGFENILSSITHDDTDVVAALLDVKQDVLAMIEGQLGKITRADREILARHDADDAKIKDIVARLEGVNETARVVQNATSQTIDEAKSEIRERLADILQSLNYSGIDQDSLSTPDAAAATCEWIWEDRHIPLRNWLWDGEGIFWITGKAESGQSTLMKFVAQHTETHRLLRIWAGACSLIVSGHYFCISGTSMHKSHEGVLRSLLLRILCTEKSLISTVCAERWEDLNHAAHAPWTRQELSTALSRIEKIERHKFCFFIDGLNEYDPQDGHLQLLDDIRKLSLLPNVKICLSGRPRTVFTEAFQVLPCNILMEDLTQADIVTYLKPMLARAEEAIEEDPGSQAGSAYASNFVGDIAAKAESAIL